MTRPTHIAFSDESCWNDGQYRSIAMVSLRTTDLKAMAAKCDECFRISAAREFKWTGQWNPTRLRAMKHVVNTLDSAAAERLCRLDVLTWNIKDSRHNVSDRVDDKNLEVMYYHLCRNVFRNRWPPNSEWALLPDRHSLVDWRNLEETLILGASSRVSAWVRPGEEFLRSYGVVSVRPAVSGKHTLIQVCDLFAGLAAFSWQNAEPYRIWNTHRRPTLFSLHERTKRSARMTLRFELLQYARLQWKKWICPTEVGLRTRNPASPINFWLYRPQHHRDKAPFREPGGRIVRARDRDRGQAIRMARRSGSGSPPPG